MLLLTFAVTEVYIPVIMRLYNLVKTYVSISRPVFEPDVVTNVIMIQLLLKQVLNINLKVEFHFAFSCKWQSKKQIGRLKYI